MFWLHHFNVHLTWINCKVLSFGWDKIRFLNIYSPVVNVKFIWETFHFKLSEVGKQPEVRYKHSIYKVLVYSLFQDFFSCFFGYFCRGGSRTAASSKMERFVITANAWEQLTIITKPSSLLQQSYNQFHNILRLFDVLPSFLFPTSETMCDYYL